MRMIQEDVNAVKQLKDQPFLQYNHETGMVVVVSDSNPLFEHRFGVFPIGGYRFHHRLSGYGSILRFFAELFDLPVYRREKSTEHRLVYDEKNVYIPFASNLNLSKIQKVLLPKDLVILNSFDRTMRLMRGDTVIAQYKLGAAVNQMNVLRSLADMCIKFSGQRELVKEETIEIKVQGLMPSTYSCPRHIEAVYYVQ